MLKGIRTYVTDADGNRGPVHRGPADFKVGQQEVHSIRIEVDDSGKVRAHVDDMLVDANLFPKLQARIQIMIWGGVFFVSAVVMLALLGGLFYFLGL